MTEEEGAGKWQVPEIRGCETGVDQGPQALVTSMTAAGCSPVLQAPSSSGVDWYVERGCPLHCNGLESLVRSHIADWMAWK